MNNNIFEKYVTLIFIILQYFEFVMSSKFDLNSEKEFKSVNWARIILTKKKFYILLDVLYNYKLFLEIIILWFPILKSYPELFAF